MFTSPSIRQIPATVPTVFAFCITGEVTANDMKGMAAFMNDQFDAHDEVSMLLIFDGFEGRAFGAGANWETMKSQVRSLGQVARYATVGAPDAASDMIEAMDKVIPVDARAFDRADEAAAWSFVGATPS